MIWHCDIRQRIGSESARGDGGFTLIELLIVITIVGFLAALTARGFGSLNGTTLTSTAAALAGDLKLARSQAINTGRTTAVTLDVEGRRWRMDGSSEHSFSQTVTVDLRTASRAVAGPATGRILFDPRGGSTGGRITLTSGRRSVVVSVEWLTGRVSIHDP